MLERFTVDSVAAEIENQIKQARPVPKLARRFYKKGRRDGRRLVPDVSMRRFTTEAVALASSKIAEEYLDVNAQIEAKINTAKGVKKQMQVRQDTKQAGSSSGGTGAVDDVPAGAASSGPAVIGNPADLDAAIEGLKAGRAAADAARVRAEQEATVKALEEAERDISQGQNDLESAKDRYRQLVESCLSTGRLLWSRYCIGYSMGKSRRGDPHADNPEPELNIELHVPAVLAPTTDKVRGS